MGATGRGFYRSDAVSSVAASPAYMLNYRNPHGAPLSLAVEVSAGANLTYTVQYTLSDLQAGETAVWIDTTNLAGKTASAAASLDSPATAVRLNVTARASGSAQLVVRQVAAEI